MPRYIDAEKAEEILRTWDMQDLYLPIHFKDFVLDETPTSDVQEVKHGQWQEQYATGTYFCSECGNDALYSCIRYNSETTIKEVLSDYCPHCGAKMDGEKNDE